MPPHVVAPHAQLENRWLRMLKMIFKQHLQAMKNMYVIESFLYRAVLVLWGLEKVAGKKHLRIFFQQASCSSGDPVPRCSPPGTSEFWRSLTRHRRHQPNRAAWKIHNSWSPRGGWVMWTSWEWALGAETSPDFTGGATLHSLQNECYVYYSPPEEEHSSFKRIKQEKYDEMLHAALWTHIKPYNTVEMCKNYSKDWATYVLSIQNTKAKVWQQSSTYHEFMWPFSLTTLRSDDSDQSACLHCWLACLKVNGFFEGVYV